MRFDIHPFKTDEEARVWGRDKIDTAAGEARARYITTVQGQDATYKAKYDDARAYVTAGYPQDVTGFPWVRAESTETGMSPKDTADRIKTIGDTWNNVIGPNIEGARIAGKDTLTSISTVPTIVSHVAAVTAKLNNF